MEEEAGPEQILDLDLTLGTMGGKTRMVFTESGWQVDGAVVREYEQKIQELTDQLCEVNYKARESETACRRVKEGNEQTGGELSTLKFKNQLLIEMLAIAQLDESHARQSYQREKVKAEEYRRELERCYVRMLKAGVDPQR
jgi:septation ring formation regulator EzrA